MSSDKKVHLCRLKRMSLEAYRGTCRRTTGKACILVLALERKPRVLVLVLAMVRKGEEEGQGRAEKVLNNRKNGRNESGMV